ncbi:FecR family protein [Cyclobacterium xiamenense]|uniref:FecR family protein n=1 Tax=Cyclobacterium xiamenense TaxID=1297121 RepID=UPI0035CF8E3C
MKTKEDFLTDPEFVAWVKHPNPQLDRYWSNWMAANPGQVGELKLAREILLRVQYPTYQVPKGAREEVLQQLLREPERLGKRKSTARENNTGWGWQPAGQFYRTAAILLFAFGLGWLLTSVEESLPDGVVAEMYWVEKTTQPGEKLQLTLGDGSRIWLNANSRLVFPEKFDPSERTVRLIGEAYFEVEKDSLRPFHVETNGLVTTVLGTSFNIANREGFEIAISLVSGAVKVTEKTSADPVILAPGEALHHDAGSGAQRVGYFDPKVVLGWKEGWIRFDQASVNEVLQTLENWYGVEFRVKGSRPVGWEFSGEYKEQTLEEVLRSMAYVQNFRYDIEGKVVHLKF